MKLLVSALEHSANIHLQSVKEHLGDGVEFMGIFNKELGNPLIDMRSLAIMGIVDAIKKLPFFLKLSREMLALAKDADKILLIDSSGFNLPLAKKIKKAYPEKEILYYILPQAWAWKKKRIGVLTKTIDTLASILPFEASYYPKEANIEYVGHPLLDQIKEFKISLSQEIKHIAFMPGSRRVEITKLMPIYKELVTKLACKATLIIPPHFSDKEVKELYGDTSAFEISHTPHKTLYKSDFAFICSGTATLEAALIGTPFVLNYIAKSLDYFIGSRLVKLSHVGLANIMFEKMGKGILHPEYLQDTVTVENLQQAYESYNREKFLGNSKLLREYLKHGSAQRVAQLIKE
ncbi:MAG: lipid-A-disaccharide synthase [Campylobacterales bacterium]|nr:lipid-A-disaccharide synthase [Campylobacterales bacterium]